MRLDLIQKIRETGSSSAEYLSNLSNEDLKKAAIAAVSASSVIGATAAAYLYRNEIHNYFYPPQTWSEWAVSWIASPSGAGVGVLSLLAAFALAKTCKSDDDDDDDYIPPARPQPRHPVDTGRTLLRVDNGSVADTYDVILQVRNEKGGVEKKTIDPRGKSQDAMTKELIAMFGAQHSVAILQSMMFLKVNQEKLS